jgi:hypothetical protein
LGKVLPGDKRGGGLGGSFGDIREDRHVRGVGEALPRVAELRGDLLRGSAGGFGQRRGAVSEIVEADIGQVGAPGEGS